MVYHNHGLGDDDDKALEDKDLIWLRLRLQTAFLFLWSGLSGRIYEIG
jgi:hypothetical protein